MSSADQEGSESRCLARDDIENVISQLYPKLSSSEVGVWKHLYASFLRENAPRMAADLADRGVLELRKLRDERSELYVSSPELCQLINELDEWILDCEEVFEEGEVPFDLLKRIVLGARRLL